MFYVFCFALAVFMVCVGILAVRIRRFYAREFVGMEQRQAEHEKDFEEARERIRRGGRRTSGRTI